VALVVPHKRAILLEGRDGNGLVLQHPQIIWSVITMFRTCGHSLKLAAIKRTRANFKVSNTPDC